MFQEKGRAPPSFKSLTREVITNTQEGGYHLHFTSYWSGLLAWCMKMFSFYLCMCMFVCMCTHFCVYISLYICASVWCPKGNLQCHSIVTFPIVSESGSLSGLELTEKAESSLVGRFPGSNPGLQADGATNLPYPWGPPCPLYFVRLLCIIIDNTIVKGDRH